MTKKQIKEFFTRLESEEGCNLKEDKEKGYVWNCAGNRTLSNKILKLMNIPDKEINVFLSQCISFGGYCDCEILFNAKERILR